MRQRVGAVTGPSADAIVAILAERALRWPPRRSAQLSPFQAFAMLWRQQVQPAGADERLLRLVAFAGWAFTPVAFTSFVPWPASARHRRAPLVSVPYAVVPFGV